MKYSEEVTKELNKLLERNYDSEKIYNEAAKKVDDRNLKLFFERKAKQRYDFGHEIKDEINSMGEKPDKGTSFGAEVKSAIMNLKSAVVGANDRELLRKSIKTDKKAVEEYNEIIKEEQLPSSAYNLLVGQRDAINDAVTDVTIVEESMTAPKSD